MKTYLLCGLFGALLAWPACAADGDIAKAPDHLKVGDPAPKLQVSKWVQGEAVTSLEAGKVYVVEFWATWCGPCRQSIPHLNEIAAKWKDKGLVTIGIDVPGEDLDKDVMPFIRKMGDKMQYRVAIDDSSKEDAGAMNKTWMDAAGQDGIPTAFVIDKESKVVWIGHPMAGLDKVVGQVMEGTFDLNKEKDRAAAAEKNKEKLEQLEEKLDELIEKKAYEKALALVEEMVALAPDDAGEIKQARVRILIEKKDFGGALAEIEKLQKAYPEIADDLGSLRFEALVEKKDFDTALKMVEDWEKQGADIIDPDMARILIYLRKKDGMAIQKLAKASGEKHNDDPDALNQIAWGLVAAEGVKDDERDLKLAEKLATRANELAEKSDPSILDTLARVKFMQGDKKAAIDLQQKAVENAEDEMADGLKKTLESYKNDKLPPPGEDDKASTDL